MPTPAKPLCPRCGLEMRRFNDYGYESWICDKGPTGAHPWTPDEPIAVSTPASSSMDDPGPMGLDAKDGGKNELG